MLCSAFPQFPALYFIMAVSAPMFMYSKCWKTSRHFEPFWYTPKTSEENEPSSVYNQLFLSILNEKWDDLCQISDTSTINFAKIIKLHLLPYENNGLKVITPK